MKTNELVKYVRRDPYLGKGTGSYVDKGYSDTELAKLIDRVAVSLKARGERVTLAKVVNVLAELDTSPVAYFGDEGTAFVGGGYSDPVSFAPMTRQVQQVQQPISAPVSTGRSGCRACVGC